MPNKSIWIAATTLLCGAHIALAGYQPVFAGTWIIRSKAANQVRAFVLTVGMAATGPLVQIREVSGAREDKRLYEEIYAAMANSRAHPFGVGTTSRRMSHIGAGHSWCDEQDCHRLDFFIGTSKRNNSTVCHISEPRSGSS